MQKAIVIVQAGSILYHRAENWRGESIAFALRTAHFTSISLRMLESNTNQ
jgi:hypothetical protein